MTTPNLGLNVIDEGQSGAHILLNENLRTLDALIGCTVITYQDTAPPASPSNGDAYIPASGATGDWSGHDNEIAYYHDGWSFHTPNDGWIVFSSLESHMFCYVTNAWVRVPFQGTAITSLTQSISNQPTQAEVTAIQNKVNEIIASMESTGVIAS